MSDTLKKRIIAFWEGRSSRKERIALWNELNEKEKALEEEMRSTFGQPQHTDPKLSEERSEQLWEHIHKRIHKEESIRHLTTRWASVAACGLLLLLGVYWYSQQHSSTFAQEYQEAATTVQRRNGQAERVSYHLPDGSNIVLFSGSSISYANTYGITDRTIHMKGKVKFDVARNSMIPFAVYSNGYKTTALGTSFIINSQGNRNITVKLLTGKVLVQSSATAAFAMKDTYLSPGHELLVDLRARTAKVDNPVHRKTLKTSARKGNQYASSVSLTFDMKPLKDVFQAIAAYKKVDIVLTNANLDGLSFTGRFQSSDTMEIMMSILCEMNNLTYEYKENQIIIRNK